MMRFPLRLTADLAFARIIRGARPVQFVDAAEILHPDTSHPVSHDKIHEIISSRSPVVWIGGSEPLHHPGVAHLVRAITQNGHYVFLETDGMVLRRRIHEFQPVSRLFLTVRLEPGAQHRSSNRLQPGAGELAVEGIRAARLSGFAICVYIRIAPETGISAARELVEFARSLDVDGIVLSPVRGELNSTPPASQILRQKTAEARKLVGSIWWEYFSKLVDPLLLGEPRTVPTTGTSTVQLEGEASTDEEGIKVA